MRIGWPDVRRGPEVFRYVVHSEGQCGVNYFCLWGVPRPPWDSPEWIEVVW